MDLTEKIAQLEEPKFLRLFRYLLGCGGSHTLRSRPTSHSFPNSELIITQVGRNLWHGGEYSTWAFQMAYLPSCLWGCHDLGWHVEAFLKKSVRDLKERPDILENLLTITDLGGERHEPRHELDGCFYYLYTNICFPDYEKGVSSLSDVASDLFEEVLGVPIERHPVFGLSTPDTLNSKASIEVDAFVTDLLNMPSSYFFIAREGEVSVAPMTEHGSFVASSPRELRDGLPNAAWTTINSALPYERNIGGCHLSDFGALMNSPKTKEADLQSFFEETPGFLAALGQGYCEIQPHVCLFDPKKGRLIPDFMARLNESTVWDIIELKLPKHPIAIDTVNGPKLSAAAARGISELLEYRDFFASRENRNRVAEKFGTAPYEPSLVLVIGRGRTRERYEWKSLRAGFPKVQIVSYDYLFERAKECREAIKGRISD